MPICKNVAMQCEHVLIGADCAKFLLGGEALRASEFLWLYTILKTCSRELPTSEDCCSMLWLYMVSISWYYKNYRSHQKPVFGMWHALKWPTPGFDLQPLSRNWAVSAQICFCAHAPLATLEKPKEYRHRLPDGQEQFKPLMLVEAGGSRWKRVEPGAIRQRCLSKSEHRIKNKIQCDACCSKRKRNDMPNSTQSQ